MRVIAGRPALCLAVVISLSGCTATVGGSASPAPATSPASTAPASTAPDRSAAPDPRPVPTPAGTPYADAGNRFRIAPPQGWAVDTSGIRGTAVVFRDPAPTPAGARTFNANINVIVGPATGELDLAIDGARRELRTLPGYTSTADEDVVLADGTAGHLLGGTFTDQGAELRNLQMYTVRGRSSVVVTGTAPASSWASFGGVFDAALRTLVVAG
jgi:hypothetical protein